MWIAIVVVIALAAGGFFFLTGDEAQASEVILEPVSAEGEDPFTESIATSEVEVESGGIEEVAGEDASVESLGGDMPGLYGGTGEEVVCDAEALVAFLEENKAKARAFAEPLGITSRAIPDYIATLTPVLLREDTRVTNHAFENGQATPVQSVLQAGSAVMVDDLGVPRVRCACGNPLTEPEALEGEAAFEGDPWEGFDNSRLVAVSPASVPVTELELVDVETGDTYEAPTGSATGMTVEELRNGKVPWTVCDRGVAKLVDGEAREGSIEELDHRVMTVVEIRLGDVAGDGDDDGVIMTHESCGATGSFYGAFVYSEGSLLAELPLVEQVEGVTTDGRFDPQGLRIVDGVIVVPVLGFAPDDCQACGGSIPVTLRFQWNGSEFVGKGVESNG